MDGHSEIFGGNCLLVVKHVPSVRLAPTKHPAKTNLSFFSDSQASV